MIFPKNFDILNEGLCRVTRDERDDDAVAFSSSISLFREVTEIMGLSSSVAS